VKLGVVAVIEYLDDRDVLESFLLNPAGVRSVLATPARVGFVTFLIQSQIEETKCISYSHDNLTCSIACIVRNWCSIKYLGIAGFDDVKIWPKSGFLPDLEKIDVFWSWNRSQSWYSRCY